MATNSQLIKLLVQTNTGKVLAKTETTIVSGELNSSPFLKQERDSVIAIEAKEIVFDKVTGDIAIALDDPSKEILKILADSIGESDQVYIDLTKVVEDSVPQSDSIETIGVTLNKQELITETELLVFNITRVIETSQAVSDTPYVTTTKLVSDDATPSDNYTALAISLGLITDTVNAIDTFIGYQFTDEEVDAIVINPVGVVDDPEITASKVLTDVSTQTDAIQTIDSTKVLLDTPVATETFSRTFNAYKYFNESQVPSDTGVILIPDYVDLTYFSEEYVGDIIRSF